MPSLRQTGRGWRGRIGNALRHPRGTEANGYANVNAMFDGSGSRIIHVDFSMSHPPVLRGWRVVD